MNPAPNLADVVRQAALTGPVYVVMLVAAVGQLCRRRATPRACALAGTAILASLLAQVGLDAFRGWVMAEMNAAPAGQLSAPELQLLGLTSPVVNGLVDAAAILVVAWAVVLDRRPATGRKSAARPPASDLGS